MLGGVEMMEHESWSEADWNGAMHVHVKLLRSEIVKK